MRYFTGSSFCSFLCSALLLLFTVPLLSQDRDAPVDAARYSSVSTTASRSLMERQNRSGAFVIGLNWGEVPRDSADFKALRIGIVHEGMWLSENPNASVSRTLREQYPWGTGLIHSNYRLVHGGSPWLYAWSVAMQYDPVLSNRGSLYEFTPRLGDTTGAVWGFKQRDLTVGEVLEEIPNNITEPNYGRILLQDTLLKQRNQQQSLPLMTPRVVLSQPSPNILQFPSNIDEIRQVYDAWLQHPDSLFVPRSGEMFVRDYRQNDTAVRIPVYERTTTGTYKLDSAGNRIVTTLALEKWMDTTLRDDGLTLLHMKGDSTEWWLAASLRRLVNVDQISVPSSSIVMSLRVPFTVRYDTLHYDSLGRNDWTHTGTVYTTVYARFDSTSAIGDTVYHDHYGFMDNHLVAWDSTVFYIRAGMLPPYDNVVNSQARPDITLSGHFWLPRFADNDRYEAYGPDRVGPELSFPPYYSGEGTALPQTLGLPGYPKTVLRPVVEHVEMEVSYHGNVDVALDWLRFESRPARLILRGAKDSIIINETRDIYNKLDVAVPDRGLWLHSHYTADESSPAFWRVQRHIGMLMEQAGTTETGSHYRGQYIPGTRDRQNWISWLGFSSQSPVAYIRYGRGWYGNDSTGADYLQRSDRSMGLSYGYRGYRYRDQGGLHIDFTDYETALSYSGYSNWQDSLFQTMPDSIYNAVLKTPRSVQAALEYALNDRLLYNNSLLYSTVPLWCNSWMESHWQTFSNPYLSDKTLYPRTASWQNARPKTGEEVRVIHWLALTLGARGLMVYKGGSTADSAATKGEYGLTCFSSANGKSGRYFPPGQTAGPDGGDFLDSLHTIWQRMNADSIAYFMGIPKNRLYLGTRSTFEEVKRAHEYADDNGSELMRLQLQAVYNKGYKLIGSRRDSTVDMSRFLNLPYAPGSSTLADSMLLLHPELPQLVRSIHTHTGQNCPDCFEHWRDSTFYMITLLKDSAKSLDKEFVLGVVNRRCDPTIYYPPSGGTNFGDSVKFFSTIEFDSLAVGTSLNSLYAYPQYAQYGSREITLPFNYTNSSGFALLHVQEIGGSLDTVIAQNQSLAVKFKPGEGKLLRVSILQPETIVGGRLDYNGQRKIVAWPDPQDTTKLVYHMAFYRTESGRNRVYYSRSEPIARNSNQENVVWNTAIKLSEVINDENGTPILEQPDCAYPSIVVRPDPGNESDTTRVYVVFACNAQEDGENIDDDIHYIAENSFPIDADIKDLANDQRNKGYILSQSSGEDLTRWGTPVVGAAPEGNFYAWSDSLQGIGVGYKQPQQNLLGSAMYIRFSESSDSCQHPSIITYARSALQENTVGVVWQEDNQIYYSRPSYEGGLNLQRLPYGNAVFSTTQRVMRLTDDESCLPYNRMPVIYRSVETGASDSTGSGGKRTLTYDCVVWEGKDSATSNRGKLYRTTVISLDDVRGSVLTTLGGLRATPGSIYGNWYDLAQPDVAQGAVLYHSANGGSRWFNVSDSAYTLNFSGHFFFQPVKESRIWHVPQRYGSGDGRQVSYSMLPALQLLDHGLSPHLAARKEVRPTDPWRLNRRVLQQYGETNITSSAQYFYRTSSVRADDALTPMPGYKKECSKLLVIEPWVNDVPLTLSQPELVVAHDTVLTIKADTIKSNWFTIGSAAEVSFYVMGTDTSLFKASLVRQSDGARQSIPLAIATDTSARLVSQTFTNGGGDNYRLEYIRKDMAAQYVEDLYVGQIALYDSGGSGGSGGIGYMKSNSLRPVSSSIITNLAVAGSDERTGLHVYAYPNPAKDMVAISVYRTYDENEAVTGREEYLQVRIVTTLGEEVLSFETRPGGILNVPVQDMPSGVYFVRVEQRGSMTTSETGSTSFVVQK